MDISKQRYKKLKEKYLKFLKSQEVLSEPFRDKIGQLNNFYLPICKKIYKKYFKSRKTKIIGLAGGQGTGKSTISNILKIILKEGFNLTTVVFSIDDFYKTLKERKEMSKKINTLFLTRGVPGTHDEKLLLDCIKNLKSQKFKKIVIPKFDKSMDDRLPKKKWQQIKKKPKIIIFEGWCVGAKPQKKKDLLSPINTLEKDKDKNGKWRKYVNNKLNTSYKKIFKLIDITIFLKVPSFRHVYEWRLLQEQKLRIASKGKKTMNSKQIRNFIMFYERITKNMIKDLSKKAEFVIKIDDKHTLTSIQSN